MEYKGDATKSTPTHISVHQEEEVRDSERGGGRGAAADAPGAKTEASLLLHLVIRGGGAGGVAHVAVAVPPSNAIKRNGSARASATNATNTWRGGREGNRSPPLARPPPLISPSITVAAENEFNGGEGGRRTRGRGSVMPARLNTVNATKARFTAICVCIRMGIMGNTEPFTNVLQLLASTSARSHPLGTYPKTRSGR